MYVEVSLYLHTFQTATNSYQVESADVSGEYVWNQFKSKNNINEDFTSHSIVDTGKTTLIMVDFS